ncbi:hypothetical protein [Melittangium boletus]|uniref:Uncharacterized protein n=1 Tax=Melittangium boletus DSM 14713 TaxID=1294270 RepID=A0A250ILT2_9BACT|nr:hypothetical protein [Melittangium boletus]ATB32141.1 hypothetical protein MEBOL_005617 [Melittangium boletus DSM 14713]
MPLLPARLLLLATLCLPLAARAFSVTNHESLTRAAVDEALAAEGTSPLAEYREAMVSGTRKEDLNLHVKWTGWTHFFRPGTSLDTTFRKDSSARIQALWQEVEEAASHGDLERAYDRVGHLVHHIQDMAVPMHVVPVMHTLSDRFEQHPIGQKALAQPSARVLEPMSGEEAQVSLALETLVVVRSDVLAVEGGTIPWSAFWAEPTQEGPGEFGAYGTVGNAFDTPQVTWRGRTWAVDPAAYEAFVTARARAAVDYSRAFLIWATRRVTALDQARAQLARPRWIPPPALALELMGGAVTSFQGLSPVAGARALIPLPWTFGLSASYARTLGGPLAAGVGGSWTLALRSPPLLTARLGYAKGLDLRATAGAGLSSVGGALHPELPVGLRLHTQWGQRLSLSMEAQYRAFAPSAAPWAQGVTFTVGTGFTWGDN